MTEELQERLIELRGLLGLTDEGMLMLLQDEECELDKQKSLEQWLH